MKIFYYFPEVGTPMYQWQRVHFIDELQRHGVEFTTFNPLLFQNNAEATEAVINTMEKNKFDLFFSSICNPIHIDKEVLLYCKRKGIPSLSFRSDNYVIPFMDEIFSPLFDLIWITSIETQYLYNRFGANTFFAPYAANPFLFSYNDRLDLIRRACFIGTPHSSRAIMINGLTNAGVKVDTFYGKAKHEEEPPQKIPLEREMPKLGYLENHYNLMRFEAGRTMLYASIINKFKKNTTVNDSPNLTVFPRLSFDEIPNKYSQYAISLSFTSLQHTDVLKKPVKIVDLRNFEVPMSGGIEFCRYSAEMASYFAEDKEIIFFNDEEEMRDKAQFYTTKACESLLRQIKESARKRAENEHSWYKRFHDVLLSLGLII